MKITRLNNIDYHADTHTYRHDGEIIPSVTRIINTKQFFHNVPDDVLKKAALAGSKLHQDIEHYLETGVAWGGIQDFVNVFEWVKKQYGEVQAYEEIVGAQVDFGTGIVKYAGRLDIRLDKAIVEIKRKLSSDILVRQYALQCAAYDIATGEGAIAYIIVYINNNKWKVKIWDDINCAKSIFQHILMKHYCQTQIDAYFSTIGGVI